MRPFCWQSRIIIEPHALTPRAPTLRQCTIILLRRHPIHPRNNEMKRFDLNERITRAETLFGEGYNCAQAVFMAYADLFDIPHRQASAISSSLGGGVGHEREACGAITGMAMIIGLAYPIASPSDKEAKGHNTEMTKACIDRFKAAYQTINCRQLLSTMKKMPFHSPTFEAHMTAIAPIRPCVRYVSYAAEILGENLLLHRAIQRSDTAPTQPQ